MELMQAHAVDCSGYQQAGGDGNRVSVDEFG